MNYMKLYHLMIDAVENAIDELEKQNVGMAKEILISAELNAEEVYISDNSEEVLEL